MSFRGLGTSFYARAAAIVLGSTLALTAAFVGVVALADRGLGDAPERFPYYVLAAAVVFVVTLLALDDEEIPGVTVIAPTIGVALTAFIVVSLGVEGVYYAVENTETVLSSFLAYFVSAGLICTGLTYWGLHHWREFAGIPERVE